MYLVPTSEVYKHRKKTFTGRIAYRFRNYLLLDLIYFFFIEHCVILLSHSNFTHN